MGSMNRAERATYIGAAGVLAPALAAITESGSPHPAFYLMLATLFLVAVMANVTPLRRFTFIHEELRKRDGGPPPPPPPRQGELSRWFQPARVASAVAAGG